MQHIENLHELDNDLPFLLESMKIEKVKKFVANLQDKTKYVIHIRNLKQALNHGLVLKKVHRMFKFNQNPWLIKPYIDMNTDLRKKANYNFEKDWSIMHVLEKLCEKTEILNLPQQKKELFSIRNKLSN